MSKLLYCISQSKSQLTLFLFFNTIRKKKLFRLLYVSDINCILSVSHTITRVRITRVVEGSNERTGAERVIRGIATSATNRTAIIQRHGVERDGAEGDRPNADKVWTRKRDEERSKERETEMATGRVCTTTGSLRCTFWYSVYVRARVQ